MLAYLPPAEARPEEIQLFSSDLGTLLEQLCPKTATEIPVAVAAAAIHPELIEQIA
jgi:hypothetical protein